MFDWFFFVLDNGLVMERVKFINLFICFRILFRLLVFLLFFVFIFFLEEMKKDFVKIKLFYLLEKIFC